MKGERESKGSVQLEQIDDDDDDEHDNLGATHLYRLKFKLLCSYIVEVIKIYGIEIIYIIYIYIYIYIVVLWLIPCDF